MDCGGHHPDAERSEISGGPTADSGVSGKAVYPIRTSHPVPDGRSARRRRAAAVPAAPGRATKVTTVDCDTNGQRPASAIHRPRYWLRLAAGAPHCSAAGRPGFIGRDVVESPIRLPSFRGRHHISGRDKPSWITQTYNGICSRVRRSGGVGVVLVAASHMHGWVRVRWGWVWRWPEPGPPTPTTISPTPPRPRRPPRRALRATPPQAPPRHRRPGRRRRRRVLRGRARA